MLLKDEIDFLVDFYSAVIMKFIRVLVFLSDIE